MYSPLDDFLADHEYYYERPVTGYTSSRLNEMREAGMKLQLLNRQVAKLEEIIRKQGAALSEKDAGHKILRSQLRELNEIKERQIRELSTAVKDLEKQNRDLDQAMKEKSEHLKLCQKKLHSLDMFLNTSIPSFERLIASFKQFTLTNSDSLQLESSVDSKDPTISSLES